MNDELEEADELVTLTLADPENAILGDKKVFGVETNVARSNIWIKNLCLIGIDREGRFVH